MKVLAFDLATHTGVAVGDAGGKPTTWSVDMTGLSDDARFATIIGMTADLIVEHDPDIVAVEEPVGGRDANAFLIGLAACARGEASRQGRRVAVHHSATVRRQFLGFTPRVRDYPGVTLYAAKKAIKGRIIAQCRQLGWAVDDDDAADAAALWWYATVAARVPQQMSFIKPIKKSRRRALPPGAKIKKPPV